MDLILVRHGQTDSNLNMKYCGQTDIELNQAGAAQVTEAAQKLYERLDGKIDSIYTSPLKRASVSAEIIAAKFNYPASDIITAGEIIEANFGIFEDMSFSEIRQKYPKEYQMWRDGSEDFVIENGESGQMVYDRASRFFKEFINNHNDGTHIFVMHMAVMSHAVSSMLELGIKAMWRFRVDNAHAAIVRVNNEKFCYLTALNV